MHRHSVKIILRIVVALVVFMASSPRVALAQWAALANAFPGHADTCLLLTDGTVMCHEYSTNHWHRLTPDINGSYINGTWSSTDCKTPCSWC